MAAVARVDLPALGSPGVDAACSVPGRERFRERDVIRLVAVNELRVTAPLLPGLALPHGKQAVHRRMLCRVGPLGLMPPLADLLR